MLVDSNNINKLRVSFLAETYNKSEEEVEAYFNQDKESAGDKKEEGKE